MKKYFLIAAITAGLFACENNAGRSGSANDSLETSSDHAAAGTTYSPAEGDVRYTGGEVQVWRNGSWTRTDEDVTLDDGITVRSNGRVVKDGEEVELEEGTVVTRTGRFFDRAGHLIEDGWQGVKKGYKEAREGVKEGYKDAKEEVKDVIRDDKQDNQN